jgi:hypothetical protein
MNSKFYAKTLNNAYIYNLRVCPLGSARNTLLLTKNDTAKLSLLLSGPVSRASCEADGPPLLPVVMQDRFPKSLASRFSPKHFALCVSSSRCHNGTLENGFQDPFYFIDFHKSLHGTSLHLN